MDPAPPTLAGEVGTGIGEGGGLVWAGGACLSWGGGRNHGLLGVEGGLPPSGIAAVGERGGMAGACVGPRCRGRGGEPPELGDCVLPVGMACSEGGVWRRCRWQAARQFMTNALGMTNGLMHMRWHTSQQSK